jgi:hypothetical protein
MSRWEEKLEEIMQRGGFGFWLIAIVMSVGFYGLLWLTMALGIAMGY